MHDIACQRILCLCTFFVLLLPSFACGNEKKEILLLHSYHQDLPWTDNITQGIQSVLEGSGLKYELHIEYMDTKRHAPENMFSALEDLYNKKYQQIPFDLIIAADNNALDFLLSRRESLFPEVPIVFCGINNFNDSLLAGQNNITGVVEDIDVKGTLTLILRLLPATKQIVVINDLTPTGKANQQKFFEAAQAFTERVTFRELVNVSTDQLKGTLRNLPDETVLLVFTFHLDRDGIWYSIQDYLTLIRENSAVPAFAFWDHYLGQGIVGGLMVSGHAQGAHAAEMALDILHGAPADTLPILRQSPNIPMFDYQLMQQFDIEEAGLPAKSILMNKPSSLYRKYTYLIWSVLLVVAFLTTLVIVLALNIVRRKRIEKDLRQSEARFRSITEQMTDMVFITDTQGTILYVSPVTERIFGYTPDQMQGKVFTEFLAEYDIPVAVEAFTGSLSSAAPCKNLHLKMKRKDDTFFWGELDGAPYRNDGIVGTIGLIRDITKRKQVEETLREREERFRTLFEEALTPILLVNEEGWYIDANQSALEFLECSREELLGKQVWDFSPPDFLERQKQEHAPFVNRRTLETDYWVHGRIKTLLLNVVPLEIQGQPILYGIGQDITERKRAIQALKENEKLLRRVIDTDPNCIFLKDKSSRFLLVNEAMAGLHGTTPQEMLGKTDIDYLDGSMTTVQEVERFHHNDREVIDHKIPKFIPEESFTLPDGTIRWFQTNKVPIFIRDSGDCLLGVAVDITERKQAEEKIKAALQEKEVLLRELYHRTKNNMQVISAMLALKSYTVDHKDVQLIFKEIEHRIQAMALVHHKLYQSQNLSSINLREYIHDLASFLFNSYISSQRITLDIDAEDVFVLIDTAIPCGLLLNELISNALKHAFPGERAGEIGIVLRRIDYNHLELLVADNGVGVPEDFDFRRTNTLGLQNVFALAERQLDGEIQFNADHGLTCHITFRDDLYEERV